MNEIVTAWIKKCRKTGSQFAQVLTVKAIFDRVAVVTKTPFSLVVEYPKGNTRDGYRIKSERIPTSEVQEINWYQD